MSGDILTTGQLRGLGRAKLAARLTDGTLHRVLRGVYVSGELTGEAVARAVRVGKPRAVFTGLTAAQLYTGEALTLPVHAVVPQGSGRDDAEHVRFRQGRGLEVRFVGEFPVVTPVRAARDCLADDPVKARFLLEIAYKGPGGQTRMEADLAAFPGAGPALRDLCRAAAVGADSKLERTLFREVRHRGLRVEQNAVIGGYRYDGLVEGHVVVEVDSYLYHSAQANPEAKNENFIKDRHKANLAQRLGYHVLKYTDSDIDYHLGFCVDQIEALVRTTRSQVRDVELMEKESTPVWNWHHEVLSFERMWGRDAGWRD